jgi:hypothetical protein
MRIIVTGGRAWTCRPTIEAAPRKPAAAPGPHILVHGGAKGADQIAAAVAGELGWTVEGHDADWTAPCTPDCRHTPRRRRGGSTYCPVAGLRRNQLMADLGADLALAFFRSGHANRGTWDMVQRGVQAGIPVRKQWLDDLGRIHTSPQHSAPQHSTPRRWGSPAMVRQTLGQPKPAVQPPARLAQPA